MSLAYQQGVTSDDMDKFTKNQGKLRLSAIGGDPSLISANGMEAAGFDDWRRSVEEHQSPFNYKLGFITDYIEDEEQKRQMLRAVEDYYAYCPVHDPDGVDGDAPRQVCNGHGSCIMPSGADSSGKCECDSLRGVSYRGAACELNYDGCNTVSFLPGKILAPNIGLDGHYTDGCVCDSTGFLHGSFDTSSSYQAPCTEYDATYKTVYTLFIKTHGSVYSGSDLELYVRLKGTHEAVPINPKPGGYPDLTAANYVLIKDDSGNGDDTSNFEQGHLDVFGFDSPWHAMQVCKQLASSSSRQCAKRANASGAHAQQASEVASYR